MSMYVNYPPLLSPQRTMQFRTNGGSSNSPFKIIPYYTFYNLLDTGVPVIRWFSASDYSTFTITGGTTITQWASKAGGVVATAYAMSYSNGILLNNQYMLLIPENIDPGDTPVDVKYFTFTGAYINATPSYRSFFTVIRFNGAQVGSIRLLVSPDDDNMLVYIDIIYSTGYEAALYIGYKSAGSFNEIGKAFLYTGVENPGTETFLISFQFYDEGAVPTLRICVNGTIVSMTTPINTFQISGTNAQTIGQPYSGAVGTQISFYLGDMILYKEGIDNTRRQQVESYLAQKWGLESSLPSTHLNFTRPAGLPDFVPEMVVGMKNG